MTERPKKPAPNQSAVSCHVIKRYSRGLSGFTPSCMVENWLELRWRATPCDRICGLPYHPLQQAPVSPDDLVCPGVFPVTKPLVIFPEITLPGPRGQGAGRNLIQMTGSDCWWSNEDHYRAVTPNETWTSKTRPDGSVVEAWPVNPDPSLPSHLLEMCI